MSPSEQLPLSKTPEQQPATEGDTRPCPTCQGRGFTWDYDNYDGFYALCTHCDGSGRIPAGDRPATCQHLAPHDDADT